MTDTYTDDDRQLLMEVVDPETREIVDLGSIDDLLAAWQRFEETEAVRQLFKGRIATAIANLTDGTNKTRRVRGTRLRAKVEMPEDGWDSSVLKECWNSYENLARKYLRIGSVYPLMREVKKMENETGPPDFEQFKRMVLEARRPPRGLPRITIEEAEPEVAGVTSDESLPF